MAAAEGVVVVLMMGTRIEGEIITAGIEEIRITTAIEGGEASEEVVLMMEATGEVGQMTGASEEVGRMMARDGRDKIAESSSGKHHQVN